MTADSQGCQFAAPELFSARDKININLKRSIFTENHQQLSEEKTSDDNIKNDVIMGFLLSGEKGRHYYSIM